MAETLAVMGKSGTGKSTSFGQIPPLGIKGLDPKDTYIINVAGKPLPFRGYLNKYPLGIKISDGGNHVWTRDPGEIVAILDKIDKTPRIKHVVIDDGGYIMGFDQVDHAQEKSRDKWIDLAVNFMSVYNKAKSLRPDLTVIFIFHTEVGNDGQVKIKTSGKLIDNVILLDGLFSILLESAVSINEKGEPDFHFITNAYGVSSAKSPYGMFETRKIPNDLGYVLEKKHEYDNANKPNN